MDKKKFLSLEKSIEKPEVSLQQREKELVQLVRMVDVNCPRIIYVFRVFRKPSK